jgi:hypothetical protein
MVGNVAMIYNSQPRLRESIAILYDTARVVATVNFVNLTPNIRLPIGMGLDKWKELKESVAKGFYDTIEAIQNFVRFKSFDNHNATEPSQEQP